MLCYVIPIVWNGLRRVKQVKLCSSFVPECNFGWFTSTVTSQSAVASRRPFLPEFLQCHLSLIEPVFQSLDRMATLMRIWYRYVTNPRNGQIRERQFAVDSYLQNMKQKNICLRSRGILCSL